MVNKHDVLIVGGGGASLRAAFAVAETNPRLSIALVLIYNSFRIFETRSSYGKSNQ